MRSPCSGQTAVKWDDLHALAFIRHGSVCLAHPLLRPWHPSDSRGLLLWRDQPCLSLFFNKMKGLLVLDASVNPFCQMLLTVAFRAEEAHPQKVSLWCSKQQVCVCVYVCVCLCVCIHLCEWRKSPILRVILEVRASSCFLSFSPSWLFSFSSSSMWGLKLPSAISH